MPVQGEDEEVCSSSSSASRWINSPKNSLGAKVLANRSGVRFGTHFRVVETIMVGVSTV